MPLYYLHRRMPDGSLQPDPTGFPIPTDAEAFATALRLSRELAEGAADTIPVAIEIHDAEGWLVTSVRVKES